MGTVQSKTMVKWGYFGAATVTAGVVVYLLKTFCVRRSTASSSRRKTSGRPVMGLRNIGATCFLNSVIQALSACNNFNLWITEKNDDVNRATASCSQLNGLARGRYYHHAQYPLIAVIHRALMLINRYQYIEAYEYAPAMLPAEIIGALAMKGHRLSTREEQDTFEFFQFIIGLLFEEVQLSHRRAQRGNVDVLLDEEDTSDVSGELISLSEIENFTVAQSNSPNIQSLFEDENILGDTVKLKTSWSFNRNSDVAGTCSGNRKNSISSGHDMPSERIALEPFRISDRIYSTRRVASEICVRCIPQSPFQGVMATRLQCLLCKHKAPLRLEPFDYITLMLPASGHDGPYNVFTLLREYLRPVTVHQVDCSGCSVNYGRPSKSSFVKEMRFAKLPASLCLHILRTSWMGGSSTKRYEYVRFPERLNLWSLKRLNEIYHDENEAEIMYANQLFAGGGGGGGDPDLTDPIQRPSEAAMRRFKNSQYRLVAVISHFGDVESGHFMTYRRCPSKAPSDKADNMWLCVSDECISPITLNAVLCTNAYMLFYEKEQSSSLL